MDEPQLKPCPFCGGEAYPDIEKHGLQGGTPAHFIACRSCAAEGPWSKVESAAVRLWNERDVDADREANPLPDQDECEACENGTDACPRHALEIHESWHGAGMFWIRGELCHERCPGVKQDREKDAAAKLAEGDS
jgi:Lar family restriction alleviation protein